MKNLIILFLLAGIVTGQAQVIQLDEARVTAKTVKAQVNGGDFTFAVEEKYSNQFLKNPIGFMKENFDIHQIIGQLKDDGYDSYSVKFMNKKGYFIANFNDQGKLLNTAQRFKNIPLPLTVKRELVKDYKGWTMTKNLYIARGKGEELNRELYRITMKNGKSSKKIKIIPVRESGGVASN